MCDSIEARTCPTSSSTTNILSCFTLWGVIVAQDVLQLAKSFNNMGTPLHIGTLLTLLNCLRLFTLFSLLTLLIDVYTVYRFQAMHAVSLTHALRMPPTSSPLRLSHELYLMDRSTVTFAYNVTAIFYRKRSISTIIVNFYHNCHFLLLRPFQQLS